MTPKPLKNNRPLAAKTSRVPTSEPAKRIAAIFHRKLTTAWTEKEVKQFRVLAKDKCFDDLTDLATVERYYFAQRKMGDRGVHRRDLITFLNNFQGELDRANLWAEAHPLKPSPRKIIPLPPVPSEPPEQLTPEDEQRLTVFMAQYLMHKKAKATG